MAITGLQFDGPHADGYARLMATASKTSSASTSTFVQGAARAAADYLDTTVGDLYRMSVEISLYEAHPHELNAYERLRMENEAAKIAWVISQVRDKALAHGIFSFSLGFAPSDAVQEAMLEGRVPAMVKVRESQTPEARALRAKELAEERARNKRYKDDLRVMHSKLTPEGLPVRNLTKREREEHAEEIALYTSQDWPFSYTEIASLPEELADYILRRLKKPTRTQAALLAKCFESHPVWESFSLSIETGDMSQETASGIIADFASHKITDSDIDGKFRVPGIYMLPSGVLCRVIFSVHGYSMFMQRREAGRYSHWKWNHMEGMGAAVPADLSPLSDDDAVEEIKKWNLSRAYPHCFHCGMPIDPKTTPSGLTEACLKGIADGFLHPVTNGIST